MKLIANGIDIEVEDTGAGLNSSGKERPVVLPIMGLGMQGERWGLRNFWKPRRFFYSACTCRDRLI